MTDKFRIKSYEIKSDSPKTLFVIEELGANHTEIRALAEELFQDKSVLYNFNKRDITTIVYTAASEKTIEGFNKFSANKTDE